MSNNDCRINDCDHNYYDCRMIIIIIIIIVQY